MFFLAPFCLLFGLAASVPFVLHLYRQRQRVVMPFSTSRFFTQAIIRAQRRLRLRRLLLLLLRMAACLLIALAFAQPILHGFGFSSSPGNRDVVIVLDDSLSMQAADRPRPSHFDLAKQQTVQLLHELSGGDRAAVITTTGRSLGDDLSNDPAALSGKLDSLTATQSAGDASTALHRAADLFDSSRHRRQLVVMISDLQASDFPTATWPQPGQPLDVVLDQVADPPKENLTLETMTVSPSNLIVGQPAAATVRIVNHGSATKEVTLTVSVNSSAQSRQKVKLLGGGSDVETIPLELNSPGSQTVLAAIDANDQLAADDSFHATVQVRPQLPVLLIDGNAAATQRRASAAFYLRAAMLASSQNNVVQVDSVSPPQLASISLEKYGVIVLADVASLPPSDWNRIENFLKRGGGAAIFLGENSDPKFYNSILAPTSIASMPATTSSTEPLHVHRIELDHPLLNRFSGEARGAILDLNIYQATHINAGSGAVLASLDNDQPLIVEQNFGKGRLITWATEPVPAMTNLPLRRAFIPLMSQMVSYLAGAGPSEVHDDNPPRSESSPLALNSTAIATNAGLWHATLTTPEKLDAAAILAMPQNWSGWWDSLLWLTLAVILVESLLAIRQSTAGSISPGMKIGLYALRAVALACVVIGLLHVQWQSNSTREVKPLIAVMVDDSKSMSVGSRYETAEKLAKELPGDLSSQNILFFDVDGKETGAGAKPQADTEGSPLVESLLKIQQSQHDQALAGIVLLSDGIDTDHADASKLNVPVYPIEVANDKNETDLADLSIDAINVNQRALVGNTVRVTADLSTKGKLDGQPITVSVLQDGTPLRSKLIEWPKDSSTQRAEIEFTPLQAGHLTFALQAGPVAGEKNLDDNRKFFTMDVRAKPITVLYIDGVLRWESKFIRDALSNDPDLNVITSIRTLPGAGGGSRGLLLPEQLAKIDVVILGDVDATFFSAAEIDALQTWVTDHGGGLLLTGGYRSFGSAGIGRTELRQILPIEFSAAENPQVDQPFSLALTEIGQDHPIFNLSSDRVRDTRFIQSLPRLDGCSRVAGVKPGAEVLAVDPGITDADGSPLPIMVCQQVGAGRSMVFAVDTTWKWRTIVGGFTGDASFYQRFWAQIIRWLAREENSKNAAGLELSASAASCKPGETVEIQAQLHPQSTLWRVSATALDSAGTSSPVEMKSAPDGTFHAAVSPKTPGRFDVIVTAVPVKVGKTEDDSAPLTQRQAITINVDQPDLEMINTTPNPMWLRQLAQRSGGQYLLPADVSNWADSLPKDKVEIQSHRRFEPWRSPFLIAVFLACLCVEWILRRKSLMM